MRQASFGSPRVSFETIGVGSFVFSLEFGMSGETNPRNHESPSSSSSRDGQLSKSGPHPQVEKVQSEKVDEKKGNSFSAVLTREKKKKRNLRGASVDRAVNVTLAGSGSDDLQPCVYRLKEKKGRKRSNEG